MFSFCSVPTLLYHDLNNKSTNGNSFSRIMKDFIILLKIRRHLKVLQNN